MSKEYRHHTVTASLDLPADLHRDVPRVVIVGDVVRVENHGGISGFCPEEIRLKSAVGDILIRGRDLKLAVLRREEIAAEGQVKAVVFHAEKGRGDGA